MLALWRPAGLGSKADVRLAFRGCTALDKPAAVKNNVTVSVISSPPCKAQHCTYGETNGLVGSWFRCRCILCLVPFWLKDAPTLKFLSHPPSLIEHHIYRFVYICNFTYIYLFIYICNYMYIYISTPLTFTVAVTFTFTFLFTFTFTSTFTFAFTFVLHLHLHSHLRLLCTFTVTFICVLHSLLHVHLYLPCDLHVLLHVHLHLTFTCTFTFTFTFIFNFTFTITFTFTIYINTYIVHLHLYVTCHIAPSESAY